MLLHAPDLTNYTLHRLDDIGFKLLKQHIAGYGHQNNTDCFSNCIPHSPPPPTKRLLTVSVSVNLLKFMRTILELVWTNIVYVSAMSRYLYSKDLR